MDRSFLSQAEVIAASRRFVCIRLTTYEDEAEEKFMASLFVGRSGGVENTTFAILAPDGKTKLTRSGRSTTFAYGDARSMAKGMNEIADRYAAASQSLADAKLPVTLTARLGLNVATGDKQPLAVVIAADPDQRTRLESHLAKVSWGDELIGRFIYASAAGSNDLKGVSGVPAGPGIVLIEPGQFGQTGKVIKQFGAQVTGDELAKGMKDALKDFLPAAKSAMDQRRDGIRAGYSQAFWETKLKVGDLDEIRAREGAKSAMQRKKP